jgi:phosphohistidine phosphatase
MVRLGLDGDGEHVRTLVLLRHAKSDRPPGVPDLQRPLAERGRREAALAGAWLAAHQQVDLVLCSPSLRTVQTADAVRDAGVSAERVPAAAVYDAEPDDILGEIALVDPAVTTLLVVGHFPGLPELALRLAGPASDADAVASVAEKFPTSALAVLETDCGWADLADGCAVLTSLVVPR